MRKEAARCQARRRMQGPGRRGPSHRLSQARQWRHRESKREGGSREWPRGGSLSPDWSSSRAARSHLPPSLNTRSADAGFSSPVSRENRRQQHLLPEGGRGPSDVMTLPSASPPSACVPTPKMAAAAAVSGVLGRVGWRLLQLRCLPGEVTAKPRPRGEAGKEARDRSGLGVGQQKPWWGVSKVKGISVEPLESRAGKSHLVDFRL